MVHRAQHMVNRDAIFWQWGSKDDLSDSLRRERGVRTPDPTYRGSRIFRGKNKGPQVQSFERVRPFLIPFPSSSARAVPRTGGSPKSEGAAAHAGQGSC